VPACETAMSSVAPRLRLVDRSTAVLRVFGANRSPATSVAVCIPARNEAATIGAIVTSVARLRDGGTVDDLVVVDDGSTDATATSARAAGARVVSTDDGPGKGQALQRAVAETTADILVFLDADVVNFTPRYVTALTSALLADPGLKLVKGAYGRPLHGQSGEGGRVTELLARPLLQRFFPELATVTQPLSGECALTRDLAERLRFDDGYGIEIGALIDTYLAYGRRAIAEVDLGGERVHRNRPLRELTVHARDVLAAVLARTGAGVPEVAGLHTAP
jgi:glucosyl-3-phosphoglycerate synthase